MSFFFIKKKFADLVLKRLLHGFSAPQTYARERTG